MMSLLCKSSLHGNFATSLSLFPRFLLGPSAARVAISLQMRLNIIASFKSSNAGQRIFGSDPHR